MQALTITQPFAWAVIHAGKLIENREWATEYRGPLAIHAGKGLSNDFYKEGAEFIRRVTGGRESPPPIAELPRGAVLGIVELVEVVRASPSLWFCGKYGLVFANPRPLKTPIRARGSLGLWSLPSDVADEIRRQGVL